MKLISTIIFGFFIILANVALVYFVFPDTIFGRAAAWFISSEQQDGATHLEPLKRVFTCQEPLPEFTLGPMSNPSDQQVANLCKCVWENLPSAAQEFATILARNADSQPSEASINLFAANFGVALNKCGGNDL